MKRHMKDDAADEQNLRARPADIAYNMMRMWQGAVGVAEVDCMVSPAYVVLEPKDSIDPTFFYYWCKTDRGRYLLWAYSYGLANDRLRLYPDDCLRIPVCFPEKAEQIEIASFLTLIDEKISTLKKRIDLLVEYKRGLFQKIFSRKIRFKNSLGEDYPDWKETKLGDVFDERNERNSPNEQLLSVTIDHGVRLASDTDKAVSASSDVSNYKLVCENDIAYNSMRMWQGASGLSSYKGIVSPAYTVLVPRDHQSALFWSYYFKVHPVVFTFQRYSQGLTSDTWNLKYPILSTITLPVPCRREQEDIANFIADIDSKIQFELDELETAEQLKKAFLQRMFTT